MAFVIWSMGMGRHICRESSVCSLFSAWVCTVFVTDMMGNLDSLATRMSVDEKSVHTSIRYEQSALV